MKHKVGYFSNQFATKNGHGVARYAHNLYNSLNQIQKDYLIEPIAAWSDREKSELDHLIKTTGLRILKSGRRFTPMAWNILDIPPVEWLLKSKPDIVHAVSLGYRIATNKPYLVTIHDLGPLTHTEFFNDKPSWIIERSLHQAVKKAEVLVCVSQATADEVEFYVKKKYGENVSDRILVAHEGVGSEFFQSVNKDQVRPHILENLNGEPFILAAGKISPRKNLDVTLEALSKLKDQITHNLITVGGDGWDFDQVKQRVAELGLQDRVKFLGFVSDDELKYLYRHAAMFIYPSLFEGFGLTILEAMASGCPVITSNLSCLPEIAGDAALLIDPKNAGSVADAMLSISESETMVNKLKYAGQVRAKSFTWDSCAEKVLQAYDRCI